MGEVVLENGAGRATQGLGEGAQTPHGPDRRASDLKSMSSRSDEWKLRAPDRPEFETLVTQCKAFDAELRATGRLVEGVRRVGSAISTRRSGPFTLQAAIAICKGPAAGLERRERLLREL